MCCYHGYCCKPTLVELLGSLDPAVRQSSEAAVEEHFLRDKLGHVRYVELVHWTEAEAAYGGVLADHRGLSHTCLTSEDEQDDGYDDVHAAQQPQ